jgi:hypothetical protein
LDGVGSWGDEFVVASSKPSNVMVEIIQEYVIAYSEVKAVVELARDIFEGGIVVK